MNDKCINCNGTCIGCCYGYNFNGNESYTHKNEPHMTITELTEIMTKYGLTIRAIPKTVFNILEKEHIDKFPNGKIEFLEPFGREMLIVEKELSLGGKFLIEQANNQNSIIQFSSKNAFDSIEEGITNFLKTSK